MEKTVKEKNLNFAIIITLFFLVCLLFLTVKQIRQSQEIRSRAAVEGISPKKGIAGGATLQTLSEVKSSWFYNWAYIPVYKTGSPYNNWDPEVWKHFVPLFYGKGYTATASRMAEICSKTSYCNKGNYYLVGNEPENLEQDGTRGSANLVRDAAKFQGEVAKRIFVKDPTAKLIILGLGYKDDIFIQNFISEWKNLWQGTEIGNLPEIIKGWHFHTYGTWCPTTDQLPRDFINVVNKKMTEVFGKVVSNQEVWITEMGGYGGTGFDRLMTCLVNAYENSSIVTRYAWFYHGCNSQVHSFCPLPWTSYNLFYPAGNGFTITQVGKKWQTMAVGPRYLTLTPTPSVTTVPSPIPTGSTSTGTPTPLITPTLTLTPIVTLSPTPGQPTVTQVPPTPTISSNTPVLNLKINFFGVFSQPANTDNLNYQDQTVKITIKTPEPNSNTVYEKNITFKATTQGDKFTYENTEEKIFSNIPPGTYNLFIKGPKHLQKKLGQTTLSAGQQTIDLSTLENSLLGGDLPLPQNGDFNNLIQDGKVNSLDYGFLVNNFNRTETNYLKVGDLNLDGIINAGDTAILAATLAEKIDEEP